MACASVPESAAGEVAGEIEIREFRSEDAEAFRLLNEAWIRKYFGIEEHDSEMLNDPEGYVIEPGGHIVMAFDGERAVGCCALILVKPGVYEVAKMAVDEDLRGRGIGRKVLAYTIAEAKRMGATLLKLETNSRLENAVHLYEALGFRHVAPEASPYARANVFMEMAV